MRFVAYSPALAEREVLSVDGVAPCGPNLSHWPGNRTPAQYRAPTSTGSVLKALADAKGWPKLWRELVTNTHYDTDGLLSVALALRPELAPGAADLLEASVAGDLSRFPSRSAVILDRCIAGLNEHPASPLAEELRGLSSEERLQQVYGYALSRLDELRAHPERWGELWQPELEQLERDWLALNQARVELLRAAELGAVFSSQRLHRNAVRQATAPMGRQLECWGQGEVAFAYPIDTWFDGPGLSRAPRHPFARLAQRWSEADPRAVLQPPDKLDALWPELRGRVSLAPERLLELTFQTLLELDRA